MRLTDCVLTVGLVLFSATPVFADTSNVDRSNIQIGMASYYSSERNNLPTASGERVNPNAMTAAHWTLPLGTWVKVTNLFNGRSVNVKINDRSAPSQERIIDLSRAAAKAVGMMAMGIARVKVEPIPKPSKAMLVATIVPPRKPQQ